MQVFKFVDVHFFILFSQYLFNLCYIYSVLIFITVTIYMDPPLCFLISLARGFQILIFFSKNQILVLLILSVVSFSQVNKH